MTEPVIITSHQRDRLVLMPAEEYRCLTGTQNGNFPEFEQLIEPRLEKLRNTIIELANR